MDKLTATARKMSQYDCMSTMLGSANMNSHLTMESVFPFDETFSICGLLLESFNKLF